MTTCRNPDHYPQPDGPGEYDPHLHAAGPVVLAGGVPAVVDASPCHPDGPSGREAPQAALGAEVGVDTAEAADGAPEPVYDEDGLTLYQGDCMGVLAALPAESVDCVVTSPPYWSMRSYSDDQGTPWAPEGFGREPTPELYVAHTVEVLRAIRRVLKPSGSVWWNIGDGYFGAPSGMNGTAWTLDGGVPVGGAGQGTGRQKHHSTSGLKAKDMIAMPWRVGLAAQADGWWLRTDIIWAKPNVMPESVTDRPTVNHEYVLLLTKRARYYWDQDAVREPLIKGASGSTFTHGKTGVNGLGRNSTAERIDPDGRNARSVWTIPTEPNPLPHFATFPEELARRCILAGCPPDGVTLDPFAGTGTTLKVARDLGRKAIGIELSAGYAEMAQRRLRYGVRGAVRMAGGQEALL